jgi:4,5-dihydroxyphthalate decarboxylase
MFAEQQLGSDYWPVGLAKNRSTLDVVSRYMFEDGLISRKLLPEEFFPQPDLLTT